MSFILNRIYLSKPMKYFLLFICCTLYSQNIRVVDAITKEPVAYGSVFCYKGAAKVGGNYTGDDGYIDLTGIDYESIRLSCIGYKEKNINKAALSEIVYLEEEIMILDTVTVTGDAPTVLIGHSGKEQSGVWGVSRNTQSAVYIESPFKVPVLIKSFIFRPVKVEQRCAYRIHFYKERECPAPGDNDLMQRDTIFYIEKGTKGVVELDLSSFAIEMPPEGIYASIEGLGGFNTVGDEYKTPERSGFSFESFHTWEFIYYFQPDYLNGTGWININEMYRNDFTDFGVKKLKKKNFRAPSFGLRVFVPQ